jgi:hypothetical protein
LLTEDKKIWIAILFHPRLLVFAWDTPYFENLVATEKEVGAIDVYVASRQIVTTFLSE